MQLIKHPSKERWSELIKRPLVDNLSIFPLVLEMFEDIRADGDSALRKYNTRYDGFTTKQFKVSIDDIKVAINNLPEELKSSIQIAKSNIEKFHSLQQEPINKIETLKGVTCWRESRAIESVGIYIPGGSAPLFSTVLMLGVPAVLAGCKKIVLCSPPNRDGKIAPEILYTAQLLGIEHVFCIGGIQAIGAMALGTETVPRVEKIFGPGNQYVTAAKMLAPQYGVAIDMPAGPSEVLIVADASATAEFVAADLLAQAEHGPDSQVILLTSYELLIGQVIAEIKKQVSSLPRRDLVERSLQNSKIILMETLSDCMDFSNAYAPEHLILAIQDPYMLLPLIQNAGSVFLGHFSCETAGDYASGTNHTLPTNGHARAYSGVSLDSFIKKITFQELTAEGIQNLGPAIEIMAEAEHLLAHRNAVSVRLKTIQR